MSQAEFAVSLWYRLHRLTGLGAFSVGVAIATAVNFSYPVQAATLSAWTFNPNTQQLAVTVPQSVTPHYFLLAEPARLVLDIPGAQVGDVVRQRTYSGPVRRIRVSQYDANSTRIVMELAPGVVLDPQQAQLQPVNDRGQTRWLLQPLIAGSAEAAATATSATVDSAASGFDQNPPGQPLADVNADDVSTSAESLLNALEQTNLSNLPSTLSTATLPPTSDPSVRVSVPPLDSDSAADNPSPSPVANSSAPPPSPPPVSTTETEPIPISPPFLEGPDPSPPISTSPPLGPTVSSSSSGAEAPPSHRAAISPPPSPPEAIPFGQPLPTAPADSVSTSSSQPTPIPVAPVAPTSDQEGYPSSPAAGLIIPAGMTLSLQYPHSQPLELGGGPPRQEVLLLSEDLRGTQAGTLIAPVGTPVLGRFEMAESGQKFIVQAISLPGRNLPLAAESEVLGGNRQVSGNQMLLNSGIGGAALAILSGLTGVGLLAGAAVAAGTTYAISPQTVVIEPNQIITVQVMEDLLVQSEAIPKSPSLLSFSSE